MTIDERFARLEHFTAGLGEQWKKEREDHRALWRQTAEQLHDVALKLAALTDRAIDMDERLGGQIGALTAQVGAGDEMLRARIDSMISAMGEFIRNQTRYEGPDKP